MTSPFSSAHIDVLVTEGIVTGILIDQDRTILTFADPDHLNYGFISTQLLNINGESMTIALTTKKRSFDYATEWIQSRYSTMTTLTLRIHYPSANRLESN